MTERFVPRIDPRPNDLAWPELRWPPSPRLADRRASVELEAFQEEHAAELFEALDDDAAWRHVPGRPASAARLAENLAASSARGSAVYTVRLGRPLAGAACGALVGMTSYLDAVPADARVEIGATLYAPSLWGSAVNPSAKFLLLAHAFDGLGAGRVQLKTDVRNVRSQQAIARLGATFEGVLRRYQRRGDGTIRDTVMFSILSEQWPVVRDALLDRLVGPDLIPECPPAEAADPLSSDESDDEAPPCRG